VALVSVITIVKDHPLGLRETFASLSEQDFLDWELLIIVGPSQDSTLATAREMATSGRDVKVIEQLGSGIYGAMNEGIRKAKGEFVWFMNAGDKFADCDVLSSAVDEITKTEAGVVIGGYRLNRTVQKDRSFPSGKLSAFKFAFNRRGGCHQAMIFRQKSLRNVGEYDPTHSLASDFELVLKVIKSAGAFRVSKVFASIEPGGVADKNIFQVHFQKHQIRKSIFGNNPMVTLLSWSWSVMASAKIRLRHLLTRRDHLQP
jgi:putative colanic acid biosynthesis glycosyltransferase